jgi:hypothetical protein
VTLPEFPTRDHAEAFARREFPRTLVRVISTASWEVAEEERQIIMRNKRLRLLDAEPATEDDDGA